MNNIYEINQNADPSTIIKKEAQYELAKKYEEGNGINQDFMAAANWYEQAAKLGHIEAQYELGNICDAGLCDTLNMNDAFNWYQKAAEQGHADAQYRLGGYYIHGYVTTQDLQLAMSWNKKAAEQGHADAQFYLGVFYRDEGNYIEAYKWQTIAAKLSVYLKNVTSEYEHKMTKEEIVEAEKLAKEWLDKH